MRKGFTLVELMIVIAIIAIIIAIAIPNLLSGRISANETSAIGTLKQFTSTEAIWLQQGPDGNGMKDYWTYDISALHRMLRADGVNKVAFIPIDIAQADARSNYDGATEFGVGGPVAFGNWTIATDAKNQPKSGYWFTVLDYFDDGVLDATTLYNQNEIIPTGLKTGNFNKYGFMAVPDAYANSGVRSFIVNEAGVIYGVDAGVSSAPEDSGTGFPGTPLAAAPTTAPLSYKWATDSSSNFLAWPGQNPMTMSVLATNKTWQSAE